MQRRALLKLLASGVFLMHSPHLLAKQMPKNRVKRVIWIVQRGAVDGLHTVIPTFEPALKKYRPDLFSAVQNGMPLTDKFLLHPALPSMYQMYQNKELIPIVATGSGYAGRSHFDGQDFLESALKQTNHQSGWIGRAMDTLNTEGVAISKVAPLGFRPSTRGQNHFPSRLQNATESLLEELAQLYQYDEELTDALQSAVEVKTALANSPSKKGRATFATLCKECTSLLHANPQLQFVMLESGGWDTHKSQIPRLQREFTQLDEGLLTLKRGLGEDWNNTIVIINSEFGRTVKQNGTQGTDHGTGGTMFLAGGAVKGGRILGQWPGLSQANLYQQRDLAPTSNTLAWVATAVSQHLRLSEQEMQSIFPDHGILPLKLMM